MRGIRALSSMRELAPSINLVESFNTKHFDLIEAFELVQSPEHIVSTYDTYISSLFTSILNFTEQVSSGGRFGLPYYLQKILS